jgi:two-component system sensor histidine kinase TctE
MLLPALALLLAASLWLTRAEAEQAANAAYDRSLLGAIKGLDANITSASGGLAVEQPYRLFEFFQLTSSGPVHYRVATVNGLVEIGSPDLPPPPRPLRAGEPQFYDGVYFGDALRIGAYLRALDPPLPDARQVVIQVAEGTEARARFTRTFVRQALWRDASLLGLLALVVALASAWALRPVRRLAAATGARAPGDLQPLQVQGLPADLVPLVQAINQQLARSDALVAQRRRFVDDASHQLRTPLTTLRAQLDFALREPDAGRRHEALLALSSELEHAARAANQLLSLARSDEDSTPRAPVDLGDLVRTVALSLLPQVRAMALDFGVDVPEAPLTVAGDAVQLRDALLNLAHNALVHGAGGGRVTLEAGLEDDGQWFLGVTDNGPGLDPALQGRWGERFAKGRESRGSGLGLAIARSVAERHGGRLTLAPGEGGQGLRVRITGRRT